MEDAIANITFSADGCNIGQAVRLVTDASSALVCSIPHRFAFVGGAGRTTVLKDDTLPNWSNI